ncbi:quinohemoprotein amine dehydrogenase subunit alpha [Marinobacterium sp. YM272]|uniref:quinohemoprotein amine dehydrogenase subunit alpha n=1 Tax=Marinobacterium sp. YM272 TaxID=3421654 RepID=UPI003D7FCF19
MALRIHKTKRAIVGAGVVALAGFASQYAAADGREIIRDRCLACHTESGDADTPSFSRISSQRKTPEGWLMTINRMIELRGLPISADEKREVVKYLADTQGLAPSETADYRYLLEQDTNRVESGLDGDLMQNCARCHSAARFALQRRTQDEWQTLVDFHMAQFPGLELHAGARDREWYRIVHDQTAVQLSKMFPLETQAWSNWKEADKSDLMGRWRVTGFMPGKGEFDAWMTAAKNDTDHFSLSLEGRYADGEVIAGSGKATVYTGYEWRGSLTVDGVNLRQVMSVADDGNSMNGRMFLAKERRVGGDLQAFRDSGEPMIVAVSPSYLRKGQSAELTIIGENLDGDIDLGKGVSVDRVIERSADRIVVAATAQGDEGARLVSVGEASSEAALKVYTQLARVDVTPANAVSRIGGNGSEMDKVRAIYRAVGYSAGADGKAGTEDDLRLGYMPAQWSIEPADEVAEEEKDHIYAGQITDQGIFIPGDAGPNPERFMSANNVGRLTVVAHVQDGEDKVEGEGSMLVSVPDFVQRVLD